MYWGAIAHLSQGRTAYDSVPKNARYALPAIVSRIAAVLTYIEVEKRGFNCNRE